LSPLIGLSKKIINSIETSFYNLETIFKKRNELIEKISEKYEINDLSKENLAIIDAVENKLGANLENTEKLELIRLL
jgi:GTPase SAR1 family protein